MGLLTSTLLLWAMIRALRRPGLASDLLVAGALALTVLARIGWAPLVVALVPAVLAAAWLSRPAGERAGAWLKRLPVRLLRRHPLLLPVVLAVAAYAIAVGPSALLGGEQYGGIRLAPAFHASLAWDNTRTLLAHLAIGVAIVPLVLALPLLARALVRPGDAVEGGFGWLVLGLLLAFSYAYYASMNEDRYFAVLGPPLVLAGALAVFRRPPPLWSVLTSGVVVVALVATSAETLTDPSYGYFVAPTWRFLDDAVLRRLALALPDDRDLLAAGVALAAAAAAAVLTWIVRRPRPLARIPLAVGGLVVAGVLAFQLAAMDHPARKLTQHVGMPGLPADALEFADRAVDGAVVRPLAVDGAIDPDLAAQLQLLQAYNSSITGPYFVARTADPAIPTDVLVDWDSGTAAVSTPPPAYLLQIAGAAPVGFAGTVAPPDPLPVGPACAPRRAAAGDVGDPRHAGGPLSSRRNAAGAARLPDGRAGPLCDRPDLRAPDARSTGQLPTRGRRRRRARQRAADGAGDVRTPTRSRAGHDLHAQRDRRARRQRRVRGPTLYDVRIVRCPRER